MGCRSHLWSRGAALSTAALIGAARRSGPPRPAHAPSAPGAPRRRRVLCRAEEGGAAVESTERGISPTLAILVLGGVTVLWGAQHAIIKGTLSGGGETDAGALEAAVMNLLRFALAALCFAPWLPSLPAKGPRGALEWRGGAELGFWLFLGFSLQAVGLLFTTAQRSGLLLYLNVKLVPFLGFAIFGRFVGLSAWVSAAAAFLGTCLVAGDGSGGVPPNVGDALSLAAAAASALFILRLETFAPVTDPKALNAVGMLTVALLCSAWAFGQAAMGAPGEVLSGSPLEIASYAGADLWEHIESFVVNHWTALLYLGVVTTAFTSWLQTIGQRSVPATTASAIYALDPLWGCLFAYLWLGEVLGPQGLLGCAVLLAVWAYQLWTVQVPAEGAAKRGQAVERLRRLRSSAKP